MPPDRSVQSYAAAVAANSRVAQEAAAGRVDRMLDSAHAALREKYQRAAREQLGPDADTAAVEELATRLRKVDLSRAGLASARARRERAAERQRQAEAAELDQLLNTEAP